MVHERDSGVDLHPRRQLPAGDGARRSERALRGVDDRPQAQRLLDGGLQVRVVIPGQLVAQARQHARVAQQQIERERKAVWRWSRGRLRSSVNSSSRSSTSVIVRPCSSRARSNSESTSER